MGNDGDKEHLIERYINGIQNLKDDVEIKEFFKLLASEAEASGLFGLKHTFEGGALIYDKDYDEAHRVLLIAINDDPTDFIAWNGIGIIQSYQNEYQEALKTFDRVIQCNPNRAAHWYNKGITLSALDRHEEALTAYETAIKIDPNNANAWDNKGIALSDLERYEESLTAYETAIKIDPNNASAWYNKGVTLSDLERYEESLTAYETAIKIDPNNANAWDNKGIALSDLERYEESLTAYETAIKIDPNNANAWDNKGIALHKLERHEESLTAYETAIKIDPNNASAWYNKGVTLSDLERYEESLTAYETAIKIDPNNANAWDNKGIALHKLERHEESLTAYETAIKIDPNNANAWDNKGIALHKLERHEESLTAYETAIKIDPNNASAWYNKGVTLSDLERYEESLTAYETAIKNDPNFANAWNNKGVTLYNLDRHEESLTAYETAIKIDPNFANAWNNKGVALSALDRHEEALTAHETAIKIDPNFANAWNNKGVALSALDRHEEALTAHETAIKIDPNFANAWDNKGVALSALDRHEEALTAYETAIKIDPNFANAWDSKGVALSALDRHEEALTAHETAIKIDPNFANAWYNKGIALYNLERYEEALTAYETAITIKPDFSDPWYFKYKALLELSNEVDAFRSIKHFCFLSERNDLSERASGLLSSFYHRRHAPFLLLRLTEETLRLFLTPGWLEAVKTFQNLYEVSLECIAGLICDKEKPRQLRLRTAGCLYYHMGDSILALRDFFDAMDDEFHDDLLGQYYLVLSLWEYFEDYSAALQEALEAASSYTGNDPEQLYYAARILFFAERDEEALQILRKTDDYVPALFFQFESASDKEDSELMEQLAVRILTLESKKTPNQRFLRFNQKITFDLRGTDWMHDVLHWAKQCELMPQIRSFLGTLNSKSYFYLRAKYSDALQDTLTGHMDIIAGWELDKRSSYYINQLLKGARESIHGSLRADLKTIHQIDVSRYDDVSDELLEKSLAETIKNQIIKDQSALLLISYLFHEKRLGLAASLSLSAYVEYYKKTFRGSMATKEAVFSGLINASAAAGSSTLVVSALQRIYPLDPFLLMCVGAGAPSAIATFVITMTRNRPRRDIDYSTFKKKLRKHLEKKCIDLPDDFLDDFE